MTVMAHVLRPQRLPVKAPSSLHICRGRRSTLTTVKTWTFCWWHQRSHPVWGRHQLRYVIAIRKARRGDTLVMLNHQRRHIEWQSHARARFQSPFRVSFGKKSSAKHRRLRETRPELRTQRISKRVYQKEKKQSHIEIDRKGGGFTQTRDQEIQLTLWCIFCLEKKKRHPLPEKVRRRRWQTLEWKTLTIVSQSVS